MRPFKHHTGIVIPMLEANIDTDQIVPARFLHRSRAEGYGQVLFHDLRFDGKGNERPDFLLNRDPYRKGTVFFAGPNFGCGSSREHAVWALIDYGIRAVLAPSFGDIFFNNSLKNGLLTIQIDKDITSFLAAQVEAQPGVSIDLDLEAQGFTVPGGDTLHFDIDDYRKQALLEGLSEIEITLRSLDEIKAYEKRYRAEMPWLAHESA